MPDEQTAGRVAARYARAVQISVVAITLVWHFGYDVVIMLRGWAVYQPRSVALAAWLIIAVVQVIGSILLLRDALSKVVAQVLAGAAVVAGTLAVGTYPPGQALSDVSWAWNTVGWVGVMLLLQRPVWEAAVLLTVNTGVTLVALIADDAWDTVTAARVVTVVYATVGVQMLFAIFARSLDLGAHQAAEHARRREELLSRQAARNAVHAGRQRRYDELRLRVLPLLRALAERRADPAAADVRRQAGIEAARLRRLFAETDDTDHPLLHELRACADVAERRGVDVTLASYGEPPALSPEDRRRLTDAPLMVLTSAATVARVTVVVDATEVVVSVVADCPPAVVTTLPPRTPHALLYDEEMSELWIETRWVRSTNSP